MAASILPSARASAWQWAARALAVAVAFTVLLGAATPAAAQVLDEQELRLLLQRVERLERQLGSVHDRLGSASAQPTPMTPSEPLPPTAAARLEVRVTEMESQMRQMNGRIEEMGFAVDQLRGRLETLISDMDQRLAALEGGEAPPRPAPGAQAQPPASGPTTVTSANETPPSAPPDAGAGSEPNLAALPQGDVEQQYQHARTFLVQGAYDEAETALRSFIEAHPKHKLAGNAQYWLGETFYVRKRYDDAAVAYLEGYQKYPESQKAPDNLLKLGMSLAHLGKKEEACATFTQLRQKFPEARTTIRQTAASQRQRLGC